MATTFETSPLYRSIVEHMRVRIQDGELAPGERIPTIDQLCSSFGVSTITAKRALSELQNLGLVRSVRGKGTFVAQRHELPEVAEPPRLARIALMVSPGFRIHSGSFFGPTWSGIEAACDAAGLEFGVVTVPAGGSDFHIDLSFTPDPAQGLIFLTTDYPYRIMHLVHEQRLAALTIDAASASAHAVLTDNLAGMAQLIDHLRGLGHERFLLAHRDPRSPNPTNENERLAAYTFLTADRGVRGDTIAADDGAGMIRALRSRKGPTAVLFTQEQPAYNFIAEARRKGLRVPEDVTVTGFDGWCHEPLEGMVLTSVEVDREALGRRAVAFLREISGEGSPARAQWVRVKPRLRIGDTSGVPGR